MNIILQDSNSVLWSLSINTIGQLTQTVVGSGNPETILLTAAPNQTFQVAITTGGQLYPIPVVSSIDQGYVFLTDVNGRNWALSVNTNGTFMIDGNPAIAAWVPNGGGAGVDNRVAGGGGGFMAVPQTPSSGKFNYPEQSGSWNGQFGSVNFTFNNTVGTYFVISNPGRAA